jgi:hypothetical protein
MVFDKIQGRLKVERLQVGLSAQNPGTDGIIYAENDIVAFTSSDRRLKENIANIEDALDKLKQVSGVEYDWIEGNEEFHPNSGHDLGVIAQDIVKIAPEAVTTRANGYMAVKYERLIPILIQAVKELDERLNRCSSKS